MKSRSFTAESRLWINSGAGSFLGEGRIALLKAIDKLGSISKAAQSMNMSYLKAWRLIESMNRAANNPVVIRSSGGKAGGGTILTNYGKKVISLYEELSAKCDTYINTELENLLNSGKY